MVRAAMKLKEQAMDALILDLTAIGQNLNAEQWYDGLLAKIGQSLQMEDALEDYWMDHLRLSPVQRWFQAIREVVLPRISKRLIIFFDELDVVRGLSFCTDEFLQPYASATMRIEDPMMEKVTFCLLGVATPSELIQDPHHPLSTSAIESSFMTSVSTKPGRWPEAWNVTLKIRSEPARSLRGSTTGLRDTPT